MADNLGEKLRRLRQESGYTQKQLQNYLGVDQSTISKIESGNRKLNSSLVEKICNLYNCTPEYLLGISDEYEQLNISFRGLNNADLNTIAKVNQLSKHIVLLRKLKDE